MTRIAILDDYIGVALEYGDWSALPDDAEITVYREAIPPERLVEELFEYEIVGLGASAQGGSLTSAPVCWATSRSDIALGDSVSA